MVIANRSTKIPSERTVADIQAMLASANASALMIDYLEGKPDSIAFKLDRNGQPIAFRLPCNWQGIMVALRKDKSVPRRLVCEEQSRRVAWRVIRDWLRAQLTLIEAGAATIEEVMLPWAITSDGETVGRKLLNGSGGLLAITKK